MDSTSNLLLDIPEKVLYNIIELCGFQSIFVLRRVCHDLRNFIDDKTPNSNLTSMTIQAHPTSIHLWYDSYRKGGRITYQNCQCDAMVKHNDMENLIENSNFLNLFFDDFELIMKHQKSKLNYFVFGQGSMGNEEEYETFISLFLQKIKSILESKKFPLKIESVNIMAFKQDHVMAILPYLDSNILKSIMIDHPNYSIARESDEKFEIDEIRKLEQWKNVEKIEILSLITNAKIEEFFHFKNVSVNLNSISAEDLNLLKDNKMSFGTLEEMDIYKYSDFEKKEDFLKSLGPFEITRQSRQENQEHKWTIQIPKSKNRLEILHDPDQSRISFYRKKNYDS